MDKDSDIKPEQLAQWLTGLFGTENSHLYYYQSVGSTMTVAKEMVLASNASHGDLIIAKKQVGGRGRRGRAWASPEGGLWFTLILKPDLPAAKQPLITLLTAVAVAETIREQTNLPASIKWPNDIQINQKKVSGIALDLVYCQQEAYLVLGVGLNVNLQLAQLNPEVQTIATTLYHELGVVSNQLQLLQCILEKIMRGLKQLKVSTTVLLTSWKELSNTLSKQVNVLPADGSEPYYGLALDIDESGALLVQIGTGEIRRVLAADVSIRY